MKFLHRHKLNIQGFAHIEIFVGIAVVAVIAVVGMRVLDQSHAATPPTSTKFTAPVSAFLGMDPDLLGDTVAQQDAVLSTMASLHVNSVRVDVNWDYVQYESSSSFYDWSQYDQLMTQIRKYNLGALFIIQGCAAWVCSNPVDGPANATQASEYGAFAADVAVRYGAGGPTAYEIWNEPNNTNFWLPSANPANYTAILKDAYTDIKADFPTEPVITGGLAPELTSAGNMDAVTFLSDIYTDGGEPYFDAVADHPYSYPALPNNVESWSGWDELSYDTPSIRSTMVAHGDSAKQVWLTEIGYPSNTTSVTGIAGPTAEADELSQVVSFAQSNSWIGGVFWYEYQDAGTTANNVEDWFGIVNASGAQKPVYSVMKSL